MIYSENFIERVLFQPIAEGADHLKIVTAYATHTMASWHFIEIAARYQRPVSITLLIGMCRFDGLSIETHQGFQTLMREEELLGHSRLSCQYVCEGPPVHSKLYIWERGGAPVSAFMGSANYTQTAFSPARRELVADCNPQRALAYFNDIESNTVYCTHSEIEEYVTLVSRHPVLFAEEGPLPSLRGSGVESVSLSFLTKNGHPGMCSGINWGQRPRRNPNQAYIPLPARIARTGFFPLGGRHFSVFTDDGRQLILRAEQDNNKAIATPLNNSLLGEYFRNRLGTANGAYVSREDFLRYGRTDVTFYKLDDEQFFMDFSHT